MLLAFDPLAQLLGSLFFEPAQLFKKTGIHDVLLDLDARVGQFDRARQHAGAAARHRSVHLLGTLGDDLKQPLPAIVHGRETSILLRD